jgi:hypothetical protein
MYVYDDMYTHMAIRIHVYIYIYIYIQIKIDLETDVMIGPHGAGLMHNIFMR